ncbi:DNA mismatch repair protein MutL [Sodiomyces alkalinus F11]|uniref:DNA mismatch repair protein MutL n=1 Tax=Sodiomyces alkalinus (strain CBS 110278 / VKM F-3762 / F11) TaxID=1314773 RepID=A0A3N2PR78_SODAK|nr:DNA mismatch repair protein MutL [Sodiomyces alkalinus F11]ROT36988.1 DNA mismatch repair protein MutL [Sodiomyces alkalinus F11]
MSISQLPPSTVRRLGASALIVSPESVVKELIDNSLDAEATCLEILLSANTVDKFLVRDNGHGISPSDFHAVGRWSHTSKLRSFDELTSKGGKTLGFRGNALASASEISSVTITTRTCKDAVATVLSLKPGQKSGGIVSQKPVSSPVGTTVEVADLHSTFPFRRKEHVKKAQKTLNNIKSLLQTYAMTRPEIRFTYKILGQSHSAWSYAPPNHADARTAALQIFGVGLVSQCV